MQDVTTALPDIVDGDVVCRPAIRRWIFVVPGIFFTLLAAFLLALIVLAFQTKKPTPQDAFALIFGLGSLHLTMLLLGVGLIVRGLWHPKNRPHWVIGADQLQFVDGWSRVSVSIPFSNLAGAELYSGIGFVPYIGLRLINPALLNSYANTRPLMYNILRPQHFAHNWIIASSESDIPLVDFLSKIQNRFEKWRACGLGSAAPSPNTDVTTTPDAQQNFTQKQL